MDRIEHNGRQYEYDADFDVFRPVQESETPLNTSMWIILVVLLTIAAFCIEYRPGIV